MSLINELHNEALRRGIIDPDREIDLAMAYELVRDMPYQRASDRRPETLIEEWRGTCSGKHYLLKALFAELGYRSRVIACTSVDDIDEAIITPELRELWEKSSGRFVDVHNYLLLELEQGEMVVDATWPVVNKKYGLKVNESFVRGQDQAIACTPLQSWVVPEEGDPQAFKDEILQGHFTQAELEFREAFIHALGEWLSEGG